MKLENKKNYKTSFSAGFTLMEVMLSVSILSMGIVGSFALIASSMAKFSSATNKIIASNLAQDGIERVRNYRDSNWLKNRTEKDGMNGWDWKIDGIGDEEKFVKFSCVEGDMKVAIQRDDMLDDTDPVNTEKMQIEKCILESKCELKKYTYTYATGSRQCISDDISGIQKDSDNNSYTKTDYPNFYRLIHIKQINDQSNSLAVTIKWIDRTGTHYLTLQEVLYNWKETGP